MMRSQFQSYNIAVEFYKVGLKISMLAHLKSQFERASSSIVLNLAEDSYNNIYFQYFPFHLAHE